MAEAVLAKTGIFSRRLTGPKDKSGRFESAGDAAKELHEHLNAWTSGLSRYGQQAAFALIAANWAVHGTRSAILSNQFAKWSIAVALLYLGTHLLLVGFLVFLVRRRHRYADDDRSRWMQDFARESKKKRSAWPYTNCIERTGEVMWCLHVIGPALSGVLLVISLFGGTPANAQRGDPSCLVSGVASIGPQRVAAITGFVAGSPVKVEDGDRAITAELQKAADVWIRSKKLGQRGLLLVVGAADRLALGKLERERFDANTGLAQARAEEVRRRLIDAISSKDPSAVPGIDEVLVLAAGPRHSPVIEKCDRCMSREGFPDDRRVDVWAIWSAPAPQKDCKPGR